MGMHGFFESDVRMHDSIEELKFWGYRLFTFRKGEDLLRDVSPLCAHTNDIKNLTPKTTRYN